MKIITIIIFLLAVKTIYSQNGLSDSDRSLPIYTYFIVHSIPHDHNAFTQGLVYDNGYLYESTGRHGESTLRKVDLNDGAILMQYRLPEYYFGEGVTIFDDKIIQLTWQEYTGFVYDKESLVTIEEFYYDTEGWGITHDGKNLIISDGSEYLYFLNPRTYALETQIIVSDNGLPITNLNELEYIQGEIYANIFGTNRIARIDPGSGNIVAWIDLGGLYQLLEKDYSVDVLNGIAYDAEHDRIFVTGKLWPKIFEIKLIQKAN